MIYNKYVTNILDSKIFSNLGIFKKIFSLKNILFIILTILLFPQFFMGDISPYGYVVLGVASLFNIPLILVLISSVISTVIFSVSSVVIFKMIMAFALFTILASLINVEGLSRKYVILVELLFSILFTEIFFNIISTNNNEFFTTVYTLVITASLYLVFIYGIYVMLNLNKNFVFSKEETLATVVVIMLTVGIFKNLTFMNFSILNIIGIVVVLIYGWKNGAIMGASAGLITGLLLCITSDLSALYMSTLAFSGFIAGLLSRVGKTGVILGFIIGNLAINYWVNGFGELTVRLSEMLIASVVLIFMPKKIERKLDKVFNKNNTLNSAYENVLDYGSNVKNRLNAVSEVFDNLSKVVLPTNKQSKEEKIKVIKKYILEYTENNCIDCKQKKKCTESKKIDELVEKIASRLENNEEIDIYASEFECENSNKIVNNIKEIYNSMKLMRIIKQKEEENNIMLSRQYKEVSKIISNVAANVKNISIVKNKEQLKIREELKLAGFKTYEDEYVNEDDNYEYTFVTDILEDIDNQKKKIAKVVSNILEQNMVIKLILNSSKTEKSRIKLISKPKYEIEIAFTGQNKTGEFVSGDSYLSVELNNLKHIIALSDGAGSGEDAMKSSQNVITNLERLLKSGFEESKTVDIINSVLKLKSNDGSFATLDMASINLKNLDAEFIKIGAAPTYIIEDSKVTNINAINIPMGLLNENEYIPIVKKLKPNSYIIQITDGVVSDTESVNDNYFSRYLNNIDLTRSAKAFAEELNKLVLKEKGNVLNDDFTILVSKVKSSENRMN